MVLLPNVLHQDCALPRSDLWGWERSQGAGRPCNAQAGRCLWKTSAKWGLWRHGAGRKCSWNKSARAEVTVMRVGRSQTAPGVLWGFQDSQEKKKPSVAAGSSWPLYFQSLTRPDCQVKHRPALLSLAAYLCPWLVTRQLFRQLRLGSNSA